jgi:class 3 adenylate cyclase
MEAERRQVTVLFTDMVGFTTFSERSGEEAAYTLMRDLSKLMGDCVREQGGNVQNFTGDGIMAVFGAPIAFEDAPLRACRAAVAILQSLNEAGPELEAKHGIRPEMRVGLNTGAAVVGRVEEGADSGVTVLGDTVNFAARLQALAEPDSVLMSEATHRLVQGMVDATFSGDQKIKGKAEPQKTYRLNAIRQGATRFEAAVSRGLSAFVGRERELDLLERGLEKARAELCVVDLAAEPGMGKSRLVYEFRRRVGKERAFVLSGSCSPDGQQTPFLPFIEVARGSFRVSAGQAEKEVSQNLEIGLTSLGLHSARNLGLLLHLLGLTVPDDALKGLDGVLIGLRTRELLQQLMEARCRTSSVVMVIEDLHWIDSASEELLGKFIDGSAKLRLLLLTTRRPEYQPPWQGRAVVTKLPLEPLPSGDIRHLMQARLGVQYLPEALARQVSEKTEGNPLFTEEILTFLSERGMLQAKAGKLEFDAKAVAAALPASAQNVLSARVDRLPLRDRALLQMAAVIGRRFDPESLARAAEETDIGSRLAAMHALDLVHTDARSTDYVFKHALLRDALYHSLLTERRQELHAKIAYEIERRSGNRLAEVVELLAHHYSQTNKANKAFTYLCGAGGKSLSVYSLDEAATNLTGALALLDQNPDCANNEQVSEFLASYTYLLNLTRQVKIMIDVLERHLPRAGRLGDDPKVVRIRHHYVITLLFNTRYQHAAAVQLETSQMANRLGDSLSMAYSLTGEMFVSMLIAPKPMHEFEILKSNALRVASETEDFYIQNWTRIMVGWDELHRGLMTHARDSAHQAIQTGRTLGDPRSTGLGLAILTWIALLSDSAAEALQYSEQALALAVTPWDRKVAIGGKGCSLVLLRQIEEGEKWLEEDRRRCLVEGDLYNLAGNDAGSGVLKVLQGDIKGGVRFLEEAISRRDNEHYRVAADWYRLFLCEIYLQIIGGNERLPLSRLLKNLPIILKVMVTAASRIRTLARHVLDNPQFDPAGHFVGRAQMILGLLYKIKKKRALAVQHLIEARRILSQFGQSPILVRVETALAELGQ